MILLLLVALAGFWFGKPPTHKPLSHIDPDREFPLVEHKSFVFVVYAHNQGDWCKKTLRSIFEQDYDHYRVIMVDDASIDGTEESAKQFILENHQDEKVILIRNESFLGPVASLHRAMDHCLNREIVLPIDAKDWLSTPDVLNRFNLAYQNPDVWLVSGLAIEYPAYKIREDGPISFYAALFKEIGFSDLLKKGSFDGYVSLLKDLSGGRVRKLQEPAFFLNLAPHLPQREKVSPPALRPLTAFPESKTDKKTDP